ncbi:MAG: serine protease [Aliivibrio sp.]|uniref:S1 family peptidase n=1 Tax=Aliivibrio sp. TaxID=1872443 RepID=UPI001A3EB935|nr:serine protease [Aliivibrio sp.]
MKYLIWFYFSLITLFSAASNSESLEISPYIVEGSYSSSYIPWQVRLETDINGLDSGPYVCGGVVINKKWVLTAAHCVDKVDHSTYSKSEIKVYAGNSFLPSSTEYSVTNVYKNPSYNHSTVEHDIALLEISADIIQSTPISLIEPAGQTRLDGAFSNVWVNEFSTYNQDNAASVIVSGWGSTHSTVNMQSNNLKQAILVGVPDGNCDALWGATSVNASTSICAIKTNPSSSTSSCGGDSGGPLVWQDPNYSGDSDGGVRLIGLVSYGLAGGCGLTSIPSVYTEVSNYLTWISTTTGISVPTLNQANVYSHSYNPFDEYTSSNSSNSSGGGSLGIFGLLLLAGVHLKRRK